MATRAGVDHAAMVQVAAELANRNAGLPLSDACIFRQEIATIRSGMQEIPAPFGERREHDDAPR